MIALLSLHDIDHNLHELGASEPAIATPLQAKSNPMDNSGVDQNRSVDNDAIQSIHQQDSELQKSTMLLSQPDIRAVTILNLPNELLRTILDHFQDPVTEYVAVQWSELRHTSNDLRLENRRTIQNLRLVCRAFNDMASALLCPVLRVDLNQRSLDRAVSVSNSPAVASGVRGICVGLHCFPGELANSLARFMEFRLDKVGEVEHSCDWHLEGLAYGEQYSDSEGDDDNAEEDGDHNREEDHDREAEYNNEKDGGDEKDSGDEKDCRQQAAVYNEALSMGHSIRISWNNYVQRAKDGGPVQANDDYQGILRTGYEAFSQKHHEQRQMLESQSFVRTLASCLVRMPNARAVGFYDEDDVFTEYYSEPELLLDNALLARLMTTPLTWREIEETKDIHHATARILSELPIAIYEAGVVLRDLDVSIFPCIRDHTLVCPEPDSAIIWSKLRAACQSLRRASFGDGLYHLPLRPDHLGPKESRHINEYVAALVSSPALESVKIYPRVFGVNDGRGHEAEYNLSSALATVKWPRIQRLAISCAGMTQAAAEALFTGLGSGCVKSLHMGSLDLIEEEAKGEKEKDGITSSWARALDILRDKLVPQVEYVYYYECYGGEFGRRSKRQNEWAWGYRRPETPSIVKQVEMYISGAVMENPVRSI